MADMRYRPLGRSGLVVSVVGIGCNNFGRKVDEAGTRAVVDAAIDAGVNLFDTADIYGNPPGESEALLGRVLKGRRDGVVIATKFGMDMQGAKAPTTAPGAPAATSSAPSRRRCAGSAPTTSTST